MLFSEHIVSISIFFREDDVAKRERTIRGQVKEITWLTEKNTIIKTQGRTHSFCKYILISNIMVPQTANWKNWKKLISQPYFLKILIPV